MNSPNESILELTTIDQWVQAFPMMQQLRTDLTEKSFLDLLHAMRKEGYQLFSLIVNNQNWPLENGAVYIALESGLQRTNAHRFFMKKN